MNKYLKIFLRYIKERGLYYKHVHVNLKDLIQSNPLDYMHRWLGNHYIEKKEWKNFLVNNTDYIEYHIILFKDFLKKRGIYNAFFRAFNSPLAKKWRIENIYSNAQETFEEYCKYNCTAPSLFIIQSFRWDSTVCLDNDGNEVDWGIVDQEWRDYLCNIRS